ncbi:DUF2325 domain-containing protein [Pseudothauera nasutitermitis]|uniref:DUF2325 domain-containing protein n=1 Tax=Pseudothauera nasutitermitis TaxID=2565930 RepID=A0A4S4B222_9RHOO|nr:DUF2325 domain-containing protein [Pseudothauera nasutitermitis]
MRLRGELIARDTALALAREERAELEAAIPGLPRRLALARRVEALVERVQDLMREPRNRPRTPRVERLADLRSKAVLCVGSNAPEIGAARRMVERAGGAFMLHALDGEQGNHDPEVLEASLVAADLVICQTGCVGHDAYWRVQDHCRRTGKQCVLVGKEAPQHVHTG